MATATGSWTRLKAQEIQDKIFDEKVEISEEINVIDEQIHHIKDKIKDEIKEEAEEGENYCLEMQEEAHNDPDLNVTCEPPTIDFIFNDERSRPLQRPSNRKQRNHHYTFDVDDNGLDINGFIIQRYRRGHKRHKFRVYLDTNENGRFDRKDELIGKTGLTRKLSRKGIGNLLDDGELGQLVVKFKKDKSNASMTESMNSMAPAEPAESMDEPIDPGAKDAAIAHPDFSEREWELLQSERDTEDKLNASMRGVGRNDSVRNPGISSVRKLIFTDSFDDQVAVIISEPYMV